MGRIANMIATMRGCSLSQIVATIEEMEDHPEQFELTAPPALIDNIPTDFDAFWYLYPRKVGKPSALKAYNAARKKKVRHTDIMAGLERFVASKPDTQYTPYPATWIRDERWLVMQPQSGPALKGLAAAKERLRQEIEDDRHPSQGSPDHRHDGSLSVWHR